MNKIESYATNVVIFDYANFLERDDHVDTMKSLGYFSKIAESNPTRVSYTKIFKEKHEEL